MKRNYVSPETTMTQVKVECNVLVSSTNQTLTEKECNIYTDNYDEEIIDFGNRYFE